MKKMIDEVSRSVKLLGDRCSKLEEELASLQAADATSQASPCMVAKPATSFQQSAGNKESIRLQTRLVQQRRQDLQHAQANFREVEARFNDLDQKEHLEDRLSELVEVVQTQPGDQVTQLVVRGLEERFANLRADVSREVATVVRESKENWVVASRRLAALEDYMVAQVFGETIEKEDKQYKKIREEQRAKKKAQEEALGISVKRSMSVPKQKSCQVSQLEQSLGHFPNPHPHDGKPRLNADPQKILRFGVSAEGNLIEVWPSHDHCTGDRLDRWASHDRGRLEILSREAEGLGRQVVHIRRELSLGRPEIAEEGLTGAPFWIQLGLFGGAEPKKIAVKSAAKMAVLATSKSPSHGPQKTDGELCTCFRTPARPTPSPTKTPVHRSRSSTTPGFPAVIGPKVGAPGTNGVLTTGEMEVAGIFCRLKFFPDGSPLRQTDGSCSLYLVCTVPNVNVRFRLFAGNRYSPVLEANTARGGRDQGRHDLCLLKDVLNEDGSVVVGAEILEANGEVVEFTADSRVVLKTSGTECAQYNLCQVRSV
ncbi:unnamed protein product [Durusdinium trenchii]|uniref:Uncharacterized protein n=1 Tax=Durusdinium trenchii TaxID=1381693 RepID=A0ABP0NF73_9DINO